MSRHAVAVFWVALGVAATLGLGGCGTPAVPTAEADPVATVEHLAGDSQPATETLSATAARRLGVATDVVRETIVNGLPRTVVPYSAVVYDPDGATWAFTATAPLSFVRVPVTVDAVHDDQAVLTAGPATGTTVVTVGVAELFGTETGVGGE